ncbi:hypothetical protein F4679DRAFT_573247 [Xylaria curta]|nr:hypothetical protein F4679DRAFT_573247 [Xylaria curta]
MFPIDVTLLPSLATRRALLVVDAQNDFLAEDGALPAKMPIDLSRRISDLVGDFRRSGGEIIWVQSRFESSRPLDEEQILISETSSPSAPAPRGRRPRTQPAASEVLVSPEAFLTLGPGNGVSCVRAGTPGIEMHPVVKQAVGPRDHVLTKTYYSAFKVDELLRLLRMRLVTELFICGSSTNIGVMATAVDAASYGYTITIVDDCCGSQSMSGHRTALRQITNTTGCETLSAAKVLGLMRPKPKPPAAATSERAGMDSRGGRAAGGRSPTVRVRRRGKNDDDAIAPSSPVVVSDIQPSLEKLSLSDEPAAANEYAPETSLAPSPPPASSSSSPPRQRQRRQPQSRSKSKRRPQPKCTPPAAAATTSANTNADNVNVRSTTNDNVDNNTNKSKGVESPTTTTEISHINTRHNSDRAVSSSKASSKLTTNKMTQQTNEESEPLCEGDTKVLYSILPPSLAEEMFTRLHAEVRWERMSHQGGEVPRLVAVQGLISPDGCKPVYRHPSDSSPPLHPFTPAVNSIRQIVESKLGHELNHVLIQLYRGGEDYISEHSDKTLDIARDSFIANVSIGAERTMTLRTKRGPEGGKREIKRAALPHNSLFQMGLQTNKRWLHGVRADKRSAREKSAAELACEGARISLTFRLIATYLDATETKIWGQGATAKTRDAAGDVVNGQTEQAIAMLRAFGRENQDSEFDWEANYGSGFDVLHIGDAKRLFLSGDSVVDLRIRAMLAEFGVSYARGSLASGEKEKGGEGGGGGGKGKPINIPIRFVDNDENKTVVDGQGMIMQYLQKTYGGITTTANDEERVRERWTQGLRILDAWRSLSSPFPSSPPLSPSSPPSSAPHPGITKTEDLLSPWEKYASEDIFIAGPEISLADFAFWPVLSDILSSSPQFRGGEEGSKKKFPHLRTYHDRMCRREGIARLLA